MVPVTFVDGEAKIDAKGDKPSLNPDAEDALVEAAEAKLEGLVAAGNILPASQKLLAAALIGSAGHRNIYALSRTVSGTDISLINKIVDALKENDPVALSKLGEKTKRQHVMTLSRDVPGGDDPDDSWVKEAVEAHNENIKTAV